MITTTNTSPTPTAICEEVPQWLVSNTNKHHVAIVLAWTAKDAKSAIHGAKPGWAARPIGHQQVIRFVRPVIVATFSIDRVHPGAMRSSLPAERQGIATRALAAAAAVFGLTTSQARFRRNPAAAKSKTAAWVALVFKGQFSRAEAGRAFGHHHSTVLYALKRAERYRTDKDAAYMAAEAAADAAIAEVAC